MDTKVLIIIGLVCLVIVVFLRKREFLSSQDLSNSIPFVDTQTAGLTFIPYITFLLNELSKNSVYSSANDILSAIDPAMSSYTSDSQIEDLFSRAYTGGEAGLPEKDRLFLREIAYYSIQYVENLESGATITYTSDGVPDFTDATIAESNKSVREFLFSVLKSDYNNILPSRFARVPTDYDIDTDTDQQRALWIIRATIIPMAYIKWLSENKWRLDATWKSSLCPASTSRTPSRISTVPGNLSFGPGTYTMAQLGNPTSLNLSAPIKVVVNTSGGSSTREIKNSIGCRGVDGNINNLSNATNIIVSLPI